jgi:hypothetical protein
MANIGAVIDKVFWFVIGIYFIFISVKQKEKLGNKAALVRFSGIVLILIGIVFSVMAMIKK